MDILITGATGLVGRALVKALDERGHRVRALTRDPTSARERLPELSAAYAWEPTVGRPPVASLEGVDAVVHLAGESVQGRWTAAKRAAIRDSRVIGTRNLVDGIAAAEDGPEALISASAIGFYGDRGEQLLTESQGAGEGFLADVVTEWEAAAIGAEAIGLRVARLRIGVVYATEGGALPQLLPLYRRGLGGPLGSGLQWWSWIHLEDLVRMLVWAIEIPVDGALNATAPEPLRQRDVSRALGRALRRPALMPAPAFAIRLALGGFSEELLSSKRVVPDRAQGLGFVFRHPTLPAALRDLLGQAGEPTADDSLDRPAAAVAS